MARLVRFDRPRRHPGRIRRDAGRSPNATQSNGRSAGAPEVQQIWRRSPPGARERSAAQAGGGCYDAPVSGEPHIRKVRPDDVEEVWRVHVASSSDLAARRGRPAARPADAPVASDARAGLASDPDGYFCAVEEGRIRGMVSALVRGRVWYLSMFFVLPGDQGRGVGRALLEIYRLEGDAAAVARLGARVELDARERELPCDPGAAEKLIAEVFGHGRADDLAHWRSDASAAVAIERGGELTAFAYRRGERIGPAAGRDETALLRAVAAAVNAGGGGNVTLRVPGACASLLEALVGCGFRIGELAIFLASRPFGRPELYLPSGPILY
ncbi:MAG: hypothetical protein DMD97_00920 [Candidatus Rokuibacteriota bacterium]|nr:MAG: hypothetical protein DMD97_00920 [Candidatus Rokubacteria bacterium]